MIGRGYLRESSNRWQGTTVDGKSDISPIDAQCIDILIDYLANKEDFELVALLSNWKKVSDDKFIDKLKEFTNSNELDGDYLDDDDSTEKKSFLDDFSPTFITFASLTFPVDYIGVIKSGSGWSQEKERNIFYIEINPKEFTNKKTSIKREFVIEETRDKELEELKMKLKKFGIKFI